MKNSIIRFVHLLSVLIFCSCEKPDAKSEIISIVKRNIELDLTPYPFSIVNDSIREHGGLSLGYTRYCTLHFDSVTYGLLKQEIRSTPYFNSVELTDDWRSQKIWSDKAPTARIGVWVASYDDSYFFIKRFDGREIDREDESLTISLDTLQSTIELTYMDFTRNIDFK